MSSSHHFLVVGTGAIGAFFASRLATVSGIKVSTICRSNYQAVKSNGVRITSPTFGDTTFKPALTFASADAAREAKRRDKLSWSHLFISTKVLLELGDPSSLIEDLVDPTSSIIICQNGLGIEDSYHSRFPHNPIISATTRTSVQQLSPGHVNHYHWTRTTLGPYTRSHSAEDNAAAMKSATEFASLLHQAGIPDIDLLSHSAMQFARWHKTAINAALNPSSVLTLGATNRALAVDPALYTHMSGVMWEILRAAEVYLGEPLPESLPSVDDVLKGVQEDMSGSRPSMWTDWAAGRKVELEAILGVPVKKAKEVGIELPRTQTLLALLRMAQEIREGEIEKDPGKRT